MEGNSSQESNNKEPLPAQPMYPLDPTAIGALRHFLEIYFPQYMYRSRKDQITILSGATSFDVSSNYMVLTGAVAITIAKIIGGYEGQILTLEFTDGNVTITDTSTSAADTVNLSGPFTGAQNDTLQLIHNGTSWRELGRGNLTNFFKNGTATRAGNTASGTQNIAHGLGRVPKKVRISAMAKWTGDDTAESIGVYNGTTTSLVYIARDAAAGNPVSGVSSTYIVYMYTSAQGYLQTASITVDATNIILAWTLTGVGNASNINLMWEVE